MNSLFIALNMLRRTLFQKKGFLMYLVIPAAAVSLIIGVLGQQSEHGVDIAYINLDRGAMGSHLLQELSMLPDYRLKQEASETALKEMVTKQKVSSAFLIPEGFSETLMKGASAQIDMYQLNINEASITLKINLDSILSRYQGTIELYSQQGFQDAALHEAVEKTISQMEKHQVKERITDLDLYVNPKMNTVIGFMLMFMMGLINNTVSVIMDDRRQRTMARTYSAPVHSFEIVLGNFIGSFLVGTLQVLVILLFTRYVTNYEYGLPFLSQFIMLEFFLLASMGIASAVASMVKNASNMSVINSLVVTPTCMLGGCFWPISFMPEWMQKIANFVPQKWVIEAIQRMASGQTLSQMWMHMGVLTLFGLILLGVGSVILRPGDAEVS
ncbi:MULTISPECIES: ABC transporter permease [unclassified Paenibacillus]|uniref:ABC transporter permease n=1 Tax=unclassified Paenibacillus TaxID=185978 RepID=UPI0027828674|nr:MULTISPECIES: ABC transporter permease [unclassified Paenibacillus]MDQ0900042.1 ABC-2 type transport system permease protein [Paenibacillus sp. V4I7]MDQ0921445.1 ABC-2 type transport system permease protein [Paenibacillus sp. V4I5]